MPWYEIKVTPTEKSEYVRGGRAINIWDDRTLQELNDARHDFESLVLNRAAFLRDQGLMEARGQIAIVSQHIISIEERVDYNIRFPKGPQERFSI
ncbi:MAG TPA: hypothetical protein VIL88_17925 [Devosia sp.]|jgi:hypothetical protein|uniref:hypothetical protein n=1 Tax=Devosia sp. TaxID=1871048 RepID=UPI002F920064